MMFVALTSVALGAEWDFFPKYAREDDVVATTEEADMPSKADMTKPAPEGIFRFLEDEESWTHNEDEVEYIIASLFELLDLDSEDVDDLVQAIENVDEEDVENLVEELISGLQGVDTGDIAVPKDKDARANGPSVKSPNPGPAECKTSWDCHGQGVYCYQGYGGMPNYCSRHSGSGQREGRGSLCRSQDACGWVGGTSRPRKMYCHHGYCEDPWQNRAAREVEDKVEYAGQPSVRSPNPGPAECESSWDCHGEGVYCMKGYGGLPNYCEKNNGVGSLCTNNASCGWIGQGDYARQMYCAYPRYARELEREAYAGQPSVKSPTPKPPTDKVCQDPGPPMYAREKDARQLRSPNPESNTECETSWDCHGEGVYCYDGVGRPNYCYKGDGLGSLCKDDASCGWLGKGDNAREMECEWVNSERRRMLPPQLKCTDPWESSSDSYDGPPVMG